MRWKIVFVGFLVTAPLFLILASGFGNNPHAVPFMLLDKPAPSFELQTLNGEKIDLVSLAGKPVVLNFWSTWCQPCKIEHPVLMQAAQAYTPLGVHFVAVLYQDDAAKARAYLRRSGSHWPTLNDPGGRTAIAYGVAGVPETFFIDSDGTIVRKVSGPVSQEVMVQTLEQML